MQEQDEGVRSGAGSSACRVQETPCSFINTLITRPSSCCWTSDKLRKNDGSKRMINVETSLGFETDETPGYQQERAVWSWVSCWDLGTDPTLISCFEITTQLSKGRVNIPDSLRDANFNPTPHWLCKPMIQSRCFRSAQTGCSYSEKESGYRISVMVFLYLKIFFLAFACYLHKPKRQVFFTLSA